MIATATTLILSTRTALGQRHASDESTIEQIQNQIIVKQSLRSDKERERAQLRRQIETARQDFDRLQQNRVKLETQLARAEEDVASSAVKLNESTALSTKKTTELVWNAISSEQLKARNPLTMLMVQSDPLKVDRMYHYHQYFVKHLKTQLDQLKRTLQVLDSLRTDTADARKQFTTVQREFETNRASLQDRQRRLTRLTAQLETEIEALDNDLAQLFLEREKLSRVIAERTPSASTSAPTPTPVPRSDVSNWPVVGGVKQRFGSLRADGRIRAEGIVIDALLGTPITAVASGVVVFAQWLEGYGNTLIIDHGDEVISLYAHCDTLYKQASEPVEAGEVVATVGVGGVEGDVGLYFEIRVRNEPMDPLRWLR